MGHWTCYDVPFRIDDPAWRQPGDPPEHPDPEPGPPDDPEAVAAEIARSIDAAAWEAGEGGGGGRGGAVRGGGGMSKIDEEIERARRRGFMVTTGLRLGDAEDRWYGLCRQRRAPFVVVHRYRAVWAAMRYDTESMTDCRWQPEITDEAEAQINHRIREIVHRHGNRNAMAFPGGERGSMRAVFAHAAEWFAAWIVRVYSHPEAFARMTDPFRPEGVEDPFALRFDWTKELDPWPENVVLRPLGVPRAGE